MHSVTNSIPGIHIFLRKEKERDSTTNNRNRPPFHIGVSCFSNAALFAFLIIASFAPRLAHSFDTIDQWQTTTPLPRAECCPDAVAFGDHVVVLSSVDGQVIVGDVGINGEITQWRYTLPNPGGANFSRVALVGNFLVVPGYPSSYVAELAADGSIVRWVQGPGTNTPATGGRGIAVDGDRIYVMGGGAPYVRFDTVETTRVDPDGTLSGWQLLTPMPKSLHDPMAIVSDGMLVVFGGEGPSGTTDRSRDVHRAPILSDGSIGQWHFVGFLLEKRPHSAFLKYDSNLHIVAGGVHGFMTETVESVPVESLGDTPLHNWSESLPTILNEHTAVVVHNFGYVIGGNNSYYGGGPQSTVYFAELGPANQPPIADAGPDQTLSADTVCEALATLDGSGSYDPDGDPLLALWESDLGAANDLVVDFAVPLGSHEFTLTVDDGNGGVDSDSMTVTVVDDSPPVLVGSFDSITAECTSPDGTPVSLPEITAEDNCDASVPVANDASSLFFLGVTTVTFSASDAAGNRSESQLEVEITDTTGPDINMLTASPEVLWPPNHKMREVSITAVANDSCDPGPYSCRIISVASNEPVTGKGTGNHAPDWEIIGDLTVNLRAERSGSGTGRIYTVEVACTDASSNESTGAALVTVPHDQGN